MSPPRDSAAAVLHAIPDDEDPVERAFRLAPIRYDEEITDAEHEAVAAAAAGHWTDGAVVSAEIQARRPR
jgi:hypothetical protein